eukprot:CAMPEP_0172451544 /NCGR_PEP_ID=MMETSP1065-20121228/9549_1 /TAXON_ID=265537 /ORGANISM="Amphiprora paludosa, Strain CCMP125" /LENGTH=231 /DNA_ID=CAMNT_0013203507 /DNA_START=201 /DNA_END=896 /DNA_ORIENTATION=+
MATSAPSLSRTPTKATTSSTATTTATPTATTEKWPCANCHSLISEDRCPFCNGIQVKIKNEREFLIRTNLGAWIERVSPATVRGSTPLSSPPMPSSDHSPTKEYHQIQRNNIYVLTATPTSHQHQSYDSNQLDQVDEELEQTSESSLINAVGSSSSSLEGGYEGPAPSPFGRPNNPVAFLLATAESPLPTLNKLEDSIMEDRQEIKQKSKDRMEENPSGTAGKKPRILFAM